MYCAVAVYWKGLGVICRLKIFCQSEQGKDGGVSRKNTYLMARANTDAIGLGGMALESHFRLRYITQFRAT
jgi:hypothetical protein